MNPTEINQAIDFYTDAFGALEVNRFTNTDGHLVYNLLIAGAHVSVSSGIFETSHGTNAMLEHVIETEDVHAAVYKATALGAQLVGKIFSNNDARIEAKISDPFGFLWVFLSLWSNSRMEHCNICHIYPAHAPALCSEYKRWKDWLLSTEPEIRNRISDLNHTLKSFEELASELNCLKAGYLLNHYNAFHSSGCLLPKIISDVHVYLELLRSTEIAMCVNPSIKGTYAVTKYFEKISEGCKQLVETLPGMTVSTGEWASKWRLELRRRVACNARQFLKDLREWRKTQEGPRNLIRQMNKEVIEEIVGGKLREQEY